MKKITSLVLAIALAVASIALVGCGKKEKPVAGLLCLHGESSTYDKNFIDAFVEACKNYGLKEGEYTIVVDVPEGEKCYTQAADLVDNGCKVVFADSFGHEEYMIKAAKEFKDVQFCHATGTQSLQENLPNYHNAFASIYEGRYLAGYAAGLKLNEMAAADANIVKDGIIKVGYVGAYTYAEVISGYTSWFLGVQAACTAGTVEMEVQFTGSWYDETAEKTAAQTLIDNGCVLISQHADSMGAPTACDAAGVPNVSYNGATGKDSFVIYSKINWVPYFTYMLENALGGTSFDTDKCGTLSDGSVVIGAAGKNAAAGTDAKLAEVAAQLKNGSLKVFDCSKFTVTVVPNTAPEGEPSNGKNVNATVDENGYLTAYNADVDGDYVGEKNVIKTESNVTYFAESEYRSAPYFDIQIDGITLLNAKF